MGWLILKEELTLAKIIAVILSLAGCAFIVDAFNPEVWHLNPLGILTGIGSGLFYAIYSLMGRSASSQRGLNPWTTLFYTFLIAAVFMLVFNLVFGSVLPGGAQKPADLFWLGKVRHRLDHPGAVGRRADPVGLRLVQRQPDPSAVLGGSI